MCVSSLSNDRSCVRRIAVVCSSRSISAAITTIVWRWRRAQASSPAPSSLGVALPALIRSASLIALSRISAAARSAAAIVRSADVPAGLRPIAAPVGLT